jgi:hypothetical protein
MFFRSVRDQECNPCCPLLTLATIRSRWQPYARTCFRSTSCEQDLDCWDSPDNALCQLLLKHTPATTATENSETESPLKGSRKRAHLRPVSSDDADSNDEHLNAREARSRAVRSSSDCDTGTGQKDHEPTHRRISEAEEFNIGDFVEFGMKKGAMWTSADVIHRNNWLPGYIIDKQGAGRHIEYTCRYWVEKLVRKSKDVLFVGCNDKTATQKISANRVRRCEDFDWIEGLRLEPLLEGDEVHARFRHSAGHKSWYRGIVKAVRNRKNYAKQDAEMYDVEFEDGDEEEGIDRRNIRGKEFDADGQPVEYTDKGKFKQKMRKGKTQDELAHSPVRSETNESPSQQRSSGLESCVGRSTKPLEQATKPRDVGGAPCTFVDSSSEEDTCMEGEAREPRQAAGDERLVVKQKKRKKVEELMSQDEARLKRQKAQVVVSFLCMCSLPPRPPPPHSPPLSLTHMYSCMRVCRMT